MAAAAFRTVSRVTRPRWLIPLVLAGSLATLRQLMLARNEIRPVG